MIQFDANFAVVVAGVAAGRAGLERPPHQGRLQARRGRQEGNVSKLAHN